MSRRRYDYLAIGHVTVDAIQDRPDGPVSQPGGGAFYSALQASLLGLDSLICTAGEPAEIERLLAPYRDASGRDGASGREDLPGGSEKPGRLDVEVVPAPQTTTLLTSGAGASRRQRVAAWAGPIERLPDVSAAIVHFAPVANETPSCLPNVAEGAELVALTPQGLVRSWDTDGWISPAPLDPARLPSRLDAVVLSAAERDCCATLLDEGGPAGKALVAVTAGAEPVQLRVPGQRPLAVATTAVERPCEDLGAGDVFAAALFARLWLGEAPVQAVRYAGAAAAVRLKGRGPEAVGCRRTIEASLQPA